ncbi:type I-E CRISPR-associated protein Cas7/Cse4/CasC [Spiractinospora alimapuensis]|uniref:type I-E CRISPR-associated protein Cas7/Cse4/CasC n=1 Tax=Spiractinospora alimapuensis TaxID=2820884 RepID=UPI001F275AFF|nr:type I-E CRISPR-associated protein Cas7/Cse4/CasC [Spiractinospora alimapuensis]QVQ51590.1 type I-E CRISPR-associated protein Cas7/Cse4/CasC [Spiractinospora alimapuensis]
MIVELHLLQSFPASNLNRDEVGQPKSVTFGGAQRGRVSSQCLKRSARLELPSLGIERENSAVRTKRLVEHAARAIDGLDPAGEDEPSDDSVALAREALLQLGFKVDHRNFTQYLFFIRPTAAALLADFCREHQKELTAIATERAKLEAEKPKKGEEKKKHDKAVENLDKRQVAPKKEIQARAAEILSADRAVDIALFGRMVANNTDFNVDAASQVAHAISTHAVVTEFDYFTAVDDLKPDDSPGADMIGTVDFNAACYYRYANLDTTQLAKNLAGAGESDPELERQAVDAWLRAFIRAVPSGKQNSMAARTQPEVLLGVVREQGSWNLANAFLKPVAGTDFMNESGTRMLEQFRELRGFYDDGEIVSVTGAAVGSAASLDLPDDERVRSVSEFVSRVSTAAFSHYG